ncbi:hypothetical protein OROHE_011603 [Orobanche hederae]
MRESVGIIEFLKMASFRDFQIHQTAVVKIQFHGKPGC